MNCLRLAFEAHGIPASEELLRMNRGKDKQAMINLVLQNERKPLHLSADIFNSFTRLLNEQVGSFEASPGIEASFQALKSLGVRVGIGTGLPKDQLSIIMEQLQWKASDFDYVGIASEVGATRPQPDMILQMMQRVQIDHKQAFLKVGDTLADVEEGKNAGVLTAAVTSGTQEVAKLMAAQPNFVIARAAEALEIVQESREA